MMPVDRPQVNDSTSETTIVRKEGHDADNRLRELTAGNQKLYDALGHYFLADPRRQIEQLGSPQELEVKAKDALSKGDKSSAFIDYDYAAKIEIYKGNGENAIKYIQEADALTEKPDEHERHQTLLSNMDKAIEYSREYQRIRAKDLENAGEVISQTEPVYSPDNAPSTVSSKVNEI